VKENEEGLNQERTVDEKYLFGITRIEMVKFIFLDWGFVVKRFYRNGLQYGQAKKTIPEG